MDNANNILNSQSVRSSSLLTVSCFFSSFFSFFFSFLSFFFTFLSFLSFFFPFFFLLLLRIPPGPGHALSFALALRLSLALSLSRSLARQLIVIFRTNAPANVSKQQASFTMGLLLAEGSEVVIFGTSSGGFVFKTLVITARNTGLYRLLSLRLCLRNLAGFGFKDQRLWLLI